MVELRDKLGAVGPGDFSGGTKAASAGDQKLNDAVLALMALGFKHADAHESVRGALAVLGPTAAVESLVRASLKKGA